LLQDGALVPMRRLVSITSMDSIGAEDARRVYHQSYALVTWMSRFRREELRSYLADMRRQRGRLETSDHVSLFEQSFGRVDELERAWLRHEHALLAER
jgi:hypothetical protein